LLYVRHLGKKKSWFQSPLTLHKTDTQIQRLLSVAEALWKKKGVRYRRTHEAKKVQLE